jgi:two-component system, chemotaxis family, chemotaxis protein CheY
MSRTDLSALTVLVVDDSRHMRTLIRSMLRAFSVTETLEAGGSEQAQGLLYGTGIDIVILDQFIAPADGLTFVRQLRQAEDNPNRLIPVIMMTAHATRETVTSARDAGVTEVLAKPVAAKPLALRLWSIIAKPRPFVRTGSGYFGPCRRRHLDSDWQGGERRQLDTMEAS